MCILESEQQKYDVIGTAKNEMRIPDHSMSRDILNVY